MNVIIDRFIDKYDFLSNFFNSLVIVEGIAYPTVEHAFQAYKTYDHDTRLKIASASTPAIAKKIGREVLLREDWDSIKDEVMLYCLRKKFKIYELEKKLTDTGDAILIEGNLWHDNYWGSCYCDRCADKLKKNKLGELLMKVREEIKNESN